MSKLTIKIIDKIFEDFKESLYISDALLKNKVKPYDFFEFLSQNLEYSKQFEKIDSYNNIYKEAQIAEKVFNGDFSKNILLEMIKANNKKKYTTRMEIDQTSIISTMTDEELDKKIQDLQNKI